MPVMETPDDTDDRLRELFHSFDSASRSSFDPHTGQANGVPGCRVAGLLLGRVLLPLHLSSLW